jgi:rhomboid protease GluP
MSNEPLWERAVRAVGLNPTQLKWRVRRWRQKAEAEARDVENQTRWLRYQHKACPRCGHPADREEKTCPACGTALSSRGVSLVQRTFQHLLPEGGATVTYLFAGLCVVLYAVMLKADGFQHITSFTLSTLVRFGALLTALVAPTGEWFRLVTFNFSHVHILHIVMNLWALLDLGPMLEEAYGRSRMVVLIVGTGIASGIASVIWYSPRFGYPGGVPTAGASGWVFGLLGAALAYAWRLGPAGAAMRAAMGRWIVYGVIVGFVIRANNAAHLGGALAGALLAVVMGTRPVAQLGRWERRLWAVLAVACLVVVAASFVLVARSPLAAALQAR